ncbi:hypothetical protein H9P43_004052 [Blastocladiella emersonii ATCC 22665]|nr:hypothetical protein H9P43_004052 [Blastocladiella emersonii ATCC 22665]
MPANRFEESLGGSEIKLAGVMSTVFDEASLSGGSALSVGTNVAVSGVRRSAKDRTSMSVTLEQCFILQAAHLMSPGDFEGMLTAMRACGTRNVERNIGKPTYAFNAIQWNILPRLYRPPKYTINQGAQS